jgi:hypothetical protein
MILAVSRVGICEPVHTVLTLVPGMRVGAARLEGLAEAGGICVSGRVQEDAEGKLEIAFENAGEQLKARPVRVYRVRLERWDINLSFWATAPGQAIHSRPPVHQHER